MAFPEGEQREEVNTTIKLVFAALRGMGDVLNEKLVRRYLHRLGQGEEDCSDKATFIRDMDIVNEADIVVSIYFSSCRLAYLIGYHIGNKGKVICLISQKQEETASVIYKENPDIVKVVYNSPQDAEILLKRAVAEMG